MNFFWSSYIGGNFDDRGNNVVFFGVLGFNLILVGFIVSSGIGINNVGFLIFDNGFFFIDELNLCGGINSICCNVFIILFIVDG